MRMRVASRSVVGSAKKITAPRASAANNRAWLRAIRNGFGKRSLLLAALAGMARHRSAGRAGKSLLKEFGPFLAFMHELGEVDEDQVLRHRPGLRIGRNRLPLGQNLLAFGQDE